MNDFGTGFAPMSSLMAEGCGEMRGYLVGRPAIADASMHMTRGSTSINLHWRPPPDEGRRPITIRARSPTPADIATTHILPAHSASILGTCLALLEMIMVGGLMPLPCAPVRKKVRAEPRILPSQ